MGQVRSVHLFRLDVLSTVLLSVTPQDGCSPFPAHIFLCVWTYSDTDRKDEPVQGVAGSVPVVRVEPELRTWVPSSLGDIIA